MRSCCWGVALVLSLAACGPLADGVEGPAPIAGNSVPPAATAAPLAETPAGERPRIVILGDSLTAGLGLPAAEAYPARLQERIDVAGWPFEIVSAAVSGDTSAGGLRRLAWALEGDVRLLVVALGGNDALRGLPVEQMRDNLAAIVDEAADRRIAVLLAGMEAPPNFGPSYTSSFRNVFRDLAGSRDLTLLPFLLEGVAGVPALNQADGIHPNAAGAERVAAHVWTALEPLLGRLGDERSKTSERVSDRP
ncbi:MAG: arylesterase [Acidobacteria bacterium]|nr:arylesterase [Acidobacteriota bacterium]